MLFNSFFHVSAGFFTDVAIVRDKCQAIHIRYQAIDQFNGFLHIVMLFQGSQVVAFLHSWAGTLLVSFNEA